MKKTILILTLFFAVNNGYSQVYSRIPADKLSKMIDLTVIAKGINDEFKEISSKWKIDSYVNLSRISENYYITKISETGEYGIKVTGTYDYKRLGIKYTGTFEAKMPADTDDKKGVKYVVITPKAQ